jgi:hypothetical protein
VEGELRKALKDQQEQVGHVIIIIIITLDIIIITTTYLIHHGSLDAEGGKGRETGPSGHLATPL